MGLDACVSNDVDVADFISTSCNSVSNVAGIGENGIIETSMLMELLTLLDLDIAYFSEKLVNMDLCMTIVSLGEIGLGDLSMLNTNISEVEFEKALIFDISIGYLDCEIIELGSFLEVLQAKMINARQKICSFKQRRELFVIFHGKLQASENSWKHLQDQLSELKRQLANFHKSISFIREKTSYPIENEDSERSHYDLQISGQQRLVLRMLEKSLAAELNLEKQFLGSKKREEELKSKLLIINEVVSGMESYIGVALGRLLEAEHCSHVFKGFAKEMMSRLQIYEFNLHCSVIREEELNAKLENSLQQLKEKENVERKLKELEEKLQVSESKLQEVNASYEDSQEQLSVMEDAHEALREHVFMAESRAHDAEEKLATVTEENIELREEVGFLKAGDSNEEKMSVLEEQVRDLEVKLQTSKSSAEASQEQQNMLYTAIWDMETLIEELKSKFSKAESRSENAEKQCLALAETNIQLNKEKGYLKSENERLVESLKVANNMKVARAKDINNGAKLITEMVMQISTERERVQKQLSSLARENTILMEELRKMRRNLLGANQSNKETYKNETESLIDNFAYGIRTSLSTAEVVETPTSATANNQEDELSERDSTDEGQTQGSSESYTAAVLSNCTNHDEAEAAGSSRFDNVGAPASNCTNHVNAKNGSNHEDSGNTKKKHTNKKTYIFAAVFVLVFSILAMNFNLQDLYPIIRRRHLDFQ